MCTSQGKELENVKQDTTRPGREASSERCVQRRLPGVVCFTPRASSVASVSQSEGTLCWSCVAHNSEQNLRIIANRWRRFFWRTTHLGFAPLHKAFHECVVLRRKTSVQRTSPIDVTRRTSTWPRSPVYSRFLALCAKFLVQSCTEGTDGRDEATAPEGDGDARRPRVPLIGYQYATRRAGDERLSQCVRFPIWLSISGVRGGTGCARGEGGCARAGLSCSYQRPRAARRVERVGKEDDLWHRAVPGSPDADPGSDPRADVQGQGHKGDDSWGSILLPHQTAHAWIHGSAPAPDSD